MISSQKCLDIIYEWMALFKYGPPSKDADNILVSSDSDHRVLLKLYTFVNEYTFEFFLESNKLEVRANSRKPRPGETRRRKTAIYENCISMNSLMEAAVTILSFESLRVQSKAALIRDLSYNASPLR